MPNGNWLQRSAYLPIVRKHVDGAGWAYEPGTDFWAIPGPAISGAAGTTSLRNLPEFGWTATSLVDTVGSGADFMASADKGIPNHWLTNATGDLLQSPAVFGDYAHAWQAMRCAGLGALPKKLVCEFWGAMSVHSANEPTSGWGLFEDGATVSTEADQLAFISTDATNFQLAANGGGGALEDAGAADDALWHLFTIELSLAGSLSYWYIDGTVQGSVAITTDEFPCMFGMHALTTNRPLLGPVHIYYSWSGVGSDLGAVVTSP
jgi:hypothetical protein